MVNYAPGGCPPFGPVSRIWHISGFEPILAEKGMVHFFWKLVYTFDRLKKSAARKTLTESQPLMACGQGSAFADLSLTAPRGVGAGRHPA